jgi:dissimilatory sulfite reductase (desulfoviridin) alpha/beta subunit
VLADAAALFGDGRLHLSIRQTPEILGVPIDSFDELVQFLTAHDMKPAACGPRVRAVSGCSGCAVNPMGLVDTQRLGIETDTSFFGTPCHGKFKITFSGCGNDCTRAKCADLGFVGMVEPGLDCDVCSACGLCVATCREGALTSSEDHRPVIDHTACSGCGDCVRVCPASAMRAQVIGLAVYAGGKHGRRPRIADHVADLLPQELVPDVVERTLGWYASHGRRGQRLGYVIEEIGAANFGEAVIPERYRVTAATRRQTGLMVR